MTCASLAAGRLPTVSGVASGDYVNTARRRRPSGIARVRAPRPASASQGRIPLYQGGLARGADPPGAGARRPDAGAARRHRARGGRQHALGLRRPIRRRRTRSPRTRSRSRPTNWRWKAPAPRNSVGTRTILDVLNAEQELLNSQVAARDRAARRLCRRLPAAERHGPGRGRRSRPRRRAALRSARQLSPRRGQLERLGRAIRATTPVATRTVTPGSEAAARA